MTPHLTYDKNLINARKILAYVAFLDNGLDAVERAYPQYVAFVLSNQGKSITQVINEVNEEPAAS